MRCRILVTFPDQDFAYSTVGFFEDALSTFQLKASKAEFAEDMGRPWERGAKRFETSREPHYLQNQFANLGLVRGFR